MLWKSPFVNSPLLLNYPFFKRNGFAVIIVCKSALTWLVSRSVFLSPHPPPPTTPPGNFYSPSLKGKKWLAASQPTNLSACKDEMNSNKHFLGQWAKCSSLLLNKKKTKQMLITKEQMSRTHNLSNIIPSVTAKGQTLERVRTFKLLGTCRLNENLKWTDHVKELVSSSHKVLLILRKLRNMGPQQVKKQLAGSLNNIVCYPLLAYLQKKVQRVQFSAASFRRNRYSIEQDVQI